MGQCCFVEKTTCPVLTLGTSLRSFCSATPLKNCATEQLSVRMVVMREKTLQLSLWSVRFNIFLGIIFSHKFTAGNTESEEGMEESVFVYI